MNLKILETALKQQLVSGKCTNEETRQIAEALIECSNLHEVYSSADIWKDEVLVVTPETALQYVGDILYDAYGRRCRSLNVKQLPFDQFKALARLDFRLKDVSVEVLQYSYDVLSDLWVENDEEGSNNPDGSYKNDNLTDVEKALLRYILNTTEVSAQNNKVVKSILDKIS